MLQSTIQNLTNDTGRSTNSLKQPN